MPEHLRALVVILALAATVFAFVRAPACVIATATRDFDRRRNLWLGITLIAFLSHNFWVFIALTAAVLLAALPRERNKLAMYFFLLFAVPGTHAEIGGMGVVNFLFDMNYLRLLSLVLLLPAFLRLRALPESEAFGRTAADKTLACYLVLSFALVLSASTLTHALRTGVFYAFVDVFLPYYVASRALRNLKEFREALMAFVVAALVLALVGAFEFAKHWLLYTSLDQALGVEGQFLAYLLRGESLRAQATTGHAIVLGYVIAVAIGFFFYIAKFFPSPTAKGLGLAALCAGLIAALSRGPWVGAVVMLLAFVATGPAAGARFAKLGLLGIIVIPVLLATPVGEKLIDYLPFVGTVDEHSVDYRRRLFEISMRVILDHPFFGTYDPRKEDAMQDMINGTGIIDIVNTYVAVALMKGFVGLFFFAGFFVVSAAGIYRGMKVVADKNDERHLLGRALLATLLGILVIIATVSSSAVVSVIYWSVAGLGVSYARMLAPAAIPVREASLGIRSAMVRRRV